MYVFVKVPIVLLTVSANVPQKALRGSASSCWDPRCKGHARRLPPRGLARLRFENLGKILGNSWEYVGNMLGICWEYMLTNGKHIWG